MNKNALGLLGDVLVLGIIAMAPLGMVLAYYYENATWLLLTAAAVIILAAG